MEVIPEFQPAMAEGQTDYLVRSSQHDSSEYHVLVRCRGEGEDGALSRMNEDQTNTSTDYNNIKKCSTTQTATSDNEQVNK